MESKYYMPELSEFFDGFEYEHLESKIWRDSKFIFRDLNVISKQINNGEIRVKLLDVEDIYNLVFCPIDINGVVLYRRGFSELGGKVGEQWIIFTRWTITIGDNFNICIERNIEDTRTKKYKKSIIFNGKIKNKSELQKLMIQLGIK